MCKYTLETQTEVKTKMNGLFFQAIPKKAQVVLCRVKYTRILCTFSCINPAGGPSKSLVRFHREVGVPESLEIPKCFNKASIKYEREILTEVKYVL